MRTRAISRRHAGRSAKFLNPKEIVAAKGVFGEREVAAVGLGEFRPASALLPREGEHLGAEVGADDAAIGIFPQKPRAYVPAAAGDVEVFFSASSAVFARERRRGFCEPPAPQNVEPPAHCAVYCVVARGDSREEPFHVLRIAPSGIGFHVIF